MGVEGYVLVGIWTIYAGMLLPLFIVKHAKDGHLKAAMYKMLLSALFTIAAIAGYTLSIQNSWIKLLLLGIVFSFFADYFLIYINTCMRRFMIGIVLFGIAQCMYIASFTTLHPIQYWEPFLAAGLLAIGVGYIYLQKIHMGKLALPVLFYAYLVIFMAVRAMSVFTHATDRVQGAILLVGAIMFLISDILLGIRKFKKDSKVLAGFLYSLYYVGQMLLITAIWIS